MKNILDAMKWRYSVNKFDATKILTNEQINGLLEAMVLAPSSYGLQPWKFIVVTNPEVRAKLQGAGYGQAKIVDASHLIVLAVNKNINDELTDTYIKSVAETRGMAVEDLKDYADMIKGAISRMSDVERVEWATRQAYIALGVLIASAAVEGIDVGPMEGFDTRKFDEILGLDEMGLVSKVAAAVGFRSLEDPAAQYKKVRFPANQVVIEVK